MTRVGIALLSVVWCFSACGSDDSSNLDGSDSSSITCSTLNLTPSAVTLVPPAGVRVVFSVETCDGAPVPDLLSEGTIDVINDETGAAFGSEGGATPALGEAKDFAFYTMLVLDLSYSIVNNGSLNSQIDGAIALIEQLVQTPMDVRQKHNVALYVFGSTAQSELVLDFTKDHNALYDALNTLKSDSGRGSTNLYGAYMSALSLVGSTGPGEEKVLRSMVLMTDGTHETGDAEQMEIEALSALNSGGVDVYTIGLAGDYDAAKLESLASTKDNFLLASEASELVEAFGFISGTVEAWSRSNYVVGICSPLEGPNRSLTLTASYGDKSGGLTALYDATGFDLTGCDPGYVSDPCGSVECGVMEGIQCDACQGGLVCIANRCEDKLCVPNRTYCDGQTLTTCDGEGDAIVNAQPCDIDSQFCLEDGTNASCVPHLCEPNSTYCDGSWVRVCDDVGSGPVTETDCAGQGKGCAEGACVDEICTPGSVYCQGQSVTQCSADGTGATVSSTCDSSGSFCLESGDTASCAPHVCAPGQPYCDENTAYVCDSSGTGPVSNSETECTAEGQACVDGACVSSPWPEVCSHLSYAGVSYVLCEEAVTWMSAKEACQSFDWKLVTVDGPQKNAWVHSQYQATAVQDAYKPGLGWVGFHELNGWVDGSEATYIPWAAGQPNSEGDHCVRTTESGEWNDAPCNSEKLPYFCESAGSCNGEECPTSIYEVTHTGANGDGLRWSLPSLGESSGGWQLLSKGSEKECAEACLNHESFKCTGFTYKFNGGEESDSFDGEACTLLEHLFATSTGHSDLNSCTML